MYYDLLLVGEFPALDLAPVLAGFLQVPVAAVLVVVEDYTAEDVDRAPGAAVLCTCRARYGDVSWQLSLSLTEAVPHAPDEAAVARAVAAGTGRAVLYPAESYPPSAHWLVAPDGQVTRARGYEGDDEDRVGWTIDAVEQPVAMLPHLRVAAMPEIEPVPPPAASRPVPPPPRPGPRRPRRSSC